MQIRQRLTYQFVSIVAIILILFSVSVYYFSANYRKENFYQRLKNKASNVANLLIDVDEVTPALLMKIEKTNPTSLPEEKILVFNYKNEVVFSTDDSNSFRISNDLLDRIRLDQEIHFKQGKSEMLGFLYKSKYDRFAVVAGAVDIPGLKKMVNLRTILLVSFGACIVVIFFAGNIYAGRALLPISNVIKQVNDISVNSMDLRVDEGNKRDEIGRLAKTFNRMLDRLVSAFIMQKNFIANASHELRTPLTVISGQLEVLLLHERSPDQYKEKIKSVLEDVKHLNLVSNRLLLLAQASSETSGSDLKAVRVDELLWQIKTDLQKLNLKYRIDIRFDEYLNETRLTILGNEQLLRSCILNLAENGCKYSPDHRVEALLTSKGEQLILRFTNIGSGIYPDDLEHIFEPFHRGRNVGSIKGHGIGLSLAQKIIELHKGKIEIQSVVNKGTEVVVSFPTDNF